MLLINKLRSNMGGFIARLIEARAKKHILSHAVISRWLKEYGISSTSTGCSYSDYLVLYRYVRIHKPKEILECGTGFSTVVIACALMENEKEFGKDWRLTSMEENSRYFEIAKKSLPVELKNDSRIELILSEVVEDNYEFFRGVRYNSVPNRPYDFVFVDGPNALTDPKSKPMTFNFDLIKIIEASSTPVRALLDTRTSTAFVYSLLFPKRFRYDYIRRIGTVLPAVKSDLADAHGIVARAMAKHAFHRPSFVELITGKYK